MDNKKDLTAAEAISIIEASAKNGVSILKFGSLEIHFGKQTDSPSKNPSDNEISDLQHKHSSDLALEKDEVENKDDKISLMLIENPAEAERLIAQGDLQDDDSGDDYGDDGPDESIHPE